MTGIGRIQKAVAAAWPFRVRPERAAAEALLQTIVAASRAPALYGPDRLADEMDARFESAVLHAALALIRLNAEPAARPIAQEFTDLLFRWLDSGLYEAGVGYQKVPKQIRAMAAQFYGRLEAYDFAIARRDLQALAEALARNIARAAAADWPFAHNLAAHAMALAARQAAAPWPGLAASALWPPMPPG